MSVRFDQFKAQQLALATAIRIELDRVLERDGAWDYANLSEAFASAVAPVVKERDDANKIAAAAKHEIERMVDLVFLLVREIQSGEGAHDDDMLIEMTEEQDDE